MVASPAPPTSPATRVVYRNSQGGFSANLIYRFNANFCKLSDTACSDKWDLLRHGWRQIGRNVAGCNSRLYI